ncbi:MAG: class I SAM-dependent methyltransferase [Chloroflexi bacterium]|nr:class I SAM-dependent methyltransferase [Chloroflexota bacterium]
MARAGHHVTGIDNSAAMLARAQERLAAEPEAVQQRVSLIEADMTRFQTTTPPFTWAILPYNTFMHLDSAQMSMALKQIARILGENGRLLIDLINPTALANTANDHLLTLENSFTDPQTGHLVVQQSSSHLDETEQTLHITWLYDASPPAGGSVQRIIAQAAYHYRYPHQLELLLHDAGFSLLTLTGDYAGSPTTKKATACCSWLGNSEYSLQFTVYSLQSTVHYPLSTVHCPLSTIHCPPFTVHCPPSRNLQINARLRIRLRQLNAHKRPRGKIGNPHSHDKITHDTQKSSPATTVPPGK